ncbi:MAG: molybdate ABC transporter substrate-binding protein [bacterium]
MLRLGILGVALWWGGLAGAETVTVFAASSLKGALDPAAAEWAAASGNVAVMSYGSSGTLAKQIEAGAPADVFVSAAVDWMDAVDGLMLAGSRRDLLGNGLSIIAHDPQAARFVVGPDMDLAAVLGGGRLAMADVTSAPAGQYGKQALTALGQWQRVQPLVVQTADDAGTVALVVLGEVPYGLVYTTDAVAAAAKGQGVEVSRLPEDSHKPIVYPAAVVASSGKPAAAAFLTYLASPAARAIFAAQGFAILPP